MSKNKHKEKEAGLSLWCILAYGLIFLTPFLFLYNILKGLSIKTEEK